MSQAPALAGSRLWRGARPAGVEDLARQRLSLSQGDASQAEKIFANAGDMHRYYVDERSAVA
jgi:hypothetical protein